MIFRVIFFFFTIFGFCFKVSDIGLPEWSDICYGAKAGLELTAILLAQLPKCREYPHAPLLERKQKTGSHATYQETLRSLKKE